MSIDTRFVAGRTGAVPPRPPLPPRSDVPEADGQSDTLAAARPSDPAPRIPLSLADRISLNDGKKQTAQSYYEVGRELARRVTGDPEAFHYQSSSMTNVGKSLKLWGLQARHGDLGTTLKSVPSTMAAVALGAVNNVPIEGAKITNGKLVEAQASGHGFNLVLNAASAVAWGVTCTFVPALLPFALATPLLTAVPLVTQRLGDTNAPVHEMAHAMQYLLLGDLMNKGLIDSSDLVAIQNDVKKSGYLWGGQTEDAAKAVERTGKPDAMFEVLRERVSQRLQERHGLGAEPIVQEANQRLNEHQAWMTKALNA